MRWIGSLGLMWAGFFFGLMGLVKGYGMLLLTAALPGIGPAMFRPHALSAISDIPTAARGRIMSIFIIGGILARFVPSGNPD